MAGAIESILAGVDLNGGLTLNELHAWMDGGTVELLLTDQNHTAFTVVFCQKMLLEIHPRTGKWIPGSFLFNEVEIPIRSVDERLVLYSSRSELRK